MKIFITGTDTDIGKTLISSWICLHFNFEYFKPIQSGCEDGTDSEKVKSLSGCVVHKESYIFKAPYSPHLASRMEGEIIDPTTIKLPDSKRLLIEGAGGILVPINDNFLVADLIKQLKTPTIVVSSSKLGTINHTLLTLEALRMRNIEILGVIMNGQLNQNNAKAIEFYGKTKVLAQVPQLDNLNDDSLYATSPSSELKEIFS